MYLNHDNNHDAAASNDDNTTACPNAWMTSQQEEEKISEEDIALNHHNTNDDDWDENDLTIILPQNSDAGAQAVQGRAYGLNVHTFRDRINAQLRQSFTSAGSQSSAIGRRFSGFRLLNYRMNSSHHDGGMNHNNSCNNSSQNIPRATMVHDAEVVVVHGSDERTSLDIVVANGRLIKPWYKRRKFWCVLMIVCGALMAVVVMIWSAPSSSSGGGQSHKKKILSNVALAEQQTLEEFYDVLNGTDWVANRGWETNESHPCDDWYGVTCDVNYRITHIGLSANGLRGSLPASIGKLEKLKTLGLFANDISSSIPTKIGSLTSLLYLRIDSNSMTSSIPTEVGMLAALDHLGLHYNRLSGTLPSELGILSNLRVAGLYVKNFVGSIPSELGLWSNVKSLTLGVNDLTGTIPSEIGLCSEVTILMLSLNSLSGDLPSELGLLTSAKQMLLVANNFPTNDDIPSEICDLVNVTKNPLKELTVNKCLKNVTLPCSCCTHCCMAPLNCFSSNKALPYTP